MIASSQPEPEQVSRKMSPDQIAKLLVQHGVKDITDQVDLQRMSCQPFASGGFGSVYRSQLRDGSLVAIKRLVIRNWDDSECIGKCRKHAAHELYTWSKCNHPGVLEVLGFALSEGSILLISPWMQNGSLTTHLMSYSTCDRLQFCIDLASTVEYLHGEGIVHGDIKGDNVILSETGGIRLGDFGSATLASYLTLCFTRTSSQLPFTFRFAAPEILHETSETHTVKSDVYSLGMQILTGTPPYAGMSDMKALIKALGNIPPPRPMFDGILQNQRASDSLWSLLLRCWDHDPNLRPTAREVKQVVSVLEFLN
ncbi:hypothetical protein RSAG8_03348, partial [Rhizoctonia solani AG-8 WAC10335]